MEEESNNPESGTAELNINEAVEYLNRLDTPEDSSVEQPEGDVELPSNDEDAPALEEGVENPDETYFDIGGEQVSLSELRDGYMRNTTFTQKAQQIAEERRVFQANMRDVNEVRGQALQAIEQIKQELAVQFQLAEQPDWEFLIENDPGEYVRQQAKWQKREAAVRQLYEAQMALSQKNAAYEQEQHENALRESNARFYEKYPDLKDRAKATEAFDKITSFLSESGFAPEEIQGISDFRIIDVMYQFVNLLEKQKAVPEVVAKIEKKPVISQKSSSRSKATSQSDAAYAKFNQTYSVNDAVAYLNSL
jgi:hypothetical protein